MFSKILNVVQVLTMSTVVIVQACLAYLLLLTLQYCCGLFPPPHPWRVLHGVLTHPAATASRPRQPLAELFLEMDITRHLTYHTRAPQISAPVDACTMYL